MSLHAAKQGIRQFSASVVLISYRQSCSMPSRKVHATSLPSTPGIEFSVTSSTSQQTQNLLKKKHILQHETELVPGNYLKL